MATDTGRFRYTRISSVQGRAHWFGITWFDDGGQAIALTGLFPKPRASIAAPGRSVPFGANNSAMRVFVDGFRLPSGHHYPEAAFPGRYPCRTRLKLPHTSKHWHALFIELVIRMVQIWNFQGAFVFVALSYPSFRGDWSTVRLHFNFLPDAPSASFP